MATYEREHLGLARLTLQLPFGFQDRALNAWRCRVTIVLADFGERSIAKIQAANNAKGVKWRI